MKQGSDKPMPVSMIVDGIAKVHTNAGQLVAEADVLNKGQRWARAFALAHFAREELAKIPLLLIAGVRVAKGTTVDWPSVRRLLADHKAKWQIVVSDLIREREYLHQAEPARFAEELSVVAYLGKLVLDGTFKDPVMVTRLWHDAVNRWGTRRFASIYVEEVKGAFAKPSDQMPPGTALNAVSRSRTAVRYYKPLIPAVVGFLADPLTEVPLPHAGALWSRLLGGGVGGVINTDLLRNEQGSAN